MQKLFTDKHLMQSSSSSISMDIRMFIIGYGFVIDSDSSFETIKLKLSLTRILKNKIECNLFVSPNKLHLAGDCQLVADSGDPCGPPSDVSALCHVRTAPSAIDPSRLPVRVHGTSCRSVHVTLGCR